MTISKNDHVNIAAYKEGWGDGSGKLNGWKGDRTGMRAGWRMAGWGE